MVFLKVEVVVAKFLMVGLWTPHWAVLEEQILDQMGQQPLRGFFSGQTEIIIWMTKIQHQLS